MTVSLVRPMYRIGWSLGLVLVNVGGAGQVHRQLPGACVIAACTSVAAASRLLESVELQHEARVALAAGGGHQFQPGNLHELPFQRRGDVVGHRLRRRARVADLHLNDRIVHGRQVVDRQAADRRARRTGSPRRSARPS